MVLWSADEMKENVVYVHRIYLALVLKSRTIAFAVATATASQFSQFSL